LSASDLIFAMETRINPSRLNIYPAGWYVLTPSDQLKRSEIQTRKLFGKELILFRTAAGLPCLADAHCPHMGGHFGHGGIVEGETIVCPFHKFCFDGNGNCTKTGYGTPPPPSAILKTYPIQEKNGFILFWFHPAGAAPQWEIPFIDDANWSEIKSTEFILNSHPQEITENSVDLGHFSVVHEYRNVHVIREIETDGPLLKVLYGFNRKPEGFFGAASKGIEVEIEVFVYGLGFSFVEVTLPQMNMRTRQYVLPMPIDENKTRLLIGMRINKKYIAGKIHPLLRFIPRNLLNKILLNKAFSGYAHDVSQDFKIWENKIYLDHPALAKGDGPIGRYRLWAKQFYV
jgi:phenylpropionate dioxygenase-like ring-hydroxylating dioxygenase large terminal subunit